MSSELHVYQLQLDYLRSTEYDITASLRACVYARAWIEANCVTGYVSLAKLDCLKSSKRESTSCRLYTGETLPIPRRTIFFSSSRFFLLFLLLLLILILLLLLPCMFRAKIAPKVPLARSLFARERLIQPMDFLRVFLAPLP